jgi:hypothetical protein
MRTPFDTRIIAPEHLETLLAGFNGNVSYHASNSDTGTKIAEMTIAAYTQQARAAAAQQELVRWVRFSNSDVSRHRDGLTTSGMGITGFGGFFVRTFFKPEDSAGETFVETGITKTIEQARNAGGWLIIHQNAETPANWIATGRIFEQINLRCRDLGIGFHPMSQIMEEEPWRSEAAKELCPAGRHIQFIARVGYVEEYHNPVSVRRDIADFTVRR